jgi:2-dehydropantoate 2-reductase
MLQDVEKRRVTEIDVINGAVVDEGKKFNVATPCNQALVWLMKTLEGSFQPGK